MGQVGFNQSVPLSDNDSHLLLQSELQANRFKLLDKVSQDDTVDENASQNSYGNHRKYPKKFLICKVFNAIYVK